MPYSQLDMPFSSSVADQRHVARRLGEIDARQMKGLRLDDLNVEFTQHAGDETYHPLPGGLGDDWRPDETQVGPAPPAGLSRSGRQGG